MDCRLIIVCCESQPTLKINQAACCGSLKLLQRQEPGMKQQSQVNFVFICLLVSVKDLTHVRGFTDSVSTVSIVCTIETRNKAHAVQLMNELNSCFEIADSSFKE